MYVYTLFKLLAKVSYLGVALPNITGILFVFPLSKAISMALYLGLFSCLKLSECSSSIIIIPRFLIGAKTALLVPTTTLASPL